MEELIKEKTTLNRTGKDVIIEYCENIKTGDIKHLQECIELKQAIVNDVIDYTFDCCPLSFGLNSYFRGDCEVEEDSDIDPLEKCKKCWKRAFEEKMPEKTILGIIKDKTINEMFCSGSVDEVYKATQVLIKRMNELEVDPKKEYFICSMVDKSEESISIDLDSF